MRGGHYSRKSGRLVRSQPFLLWPLPQPFGPLSYFVSFPRNFSFLKPPFSAVTFVVVVRTLNYWCSSACALLVFRCTVLDFRIAVRNFPRAVNSFKRCTERLPAKPGSFLTRPLIFPSGFIFSPLLACCTVLVPRTKAHTSAPRPTRGRANLG